MSKQTTLIHTYNSITFFLACQEALAKSVEKGAVCTLIPSNPSFHIKCQLSAD